MKLQIKTLNQKSLVIEIEETNTVYDLKKELSLYPDIGVKPELQKLIYAGKVLANEEKLSVYNIDVKKFLVIMILKQPLEEPSSSQQQPKQETTKEETAKTSRKRKEISPKGNTTSTPTTEPEFKTPTAPADPKKEALVAQIVGMGYTETDARRALAASFYNPERAIEYLIEGIPTTPSTPEGESYSDTDADMSFIPVDAAQEEFVYQLIRNELLENPEIIDAAVQNIGETDPAFYNLICENQQEFLRILLGSDDEEQDDLEDD